MQIQIRFNEEGALRNQRFAFTDRFTLVAELLQNARRAGATTIRVDHDPAAQSLVVEDDGCGLDDFQKLLTFNESGWDAATRDAEQPFGVGFSKCLYAARRCIVTSGLRSVDIDTAAALAKAPIDVHAVAPDLAVFGTRVELHGVHLPELPLRIEGLCQGFAVPVVFNGRPLARDLAESRLAMRQTAIGQVHLAGLDDGHFGRDSIVFLQGLCVLRPAYFTAERLNVVHLDPRQFVARLPDRDKLIDEDLQRQRIDAELKACWRSALQEAKARLAPQRFVELYYPAMRGWQQLDLLNDLDVLPASLCAAVVGYPVQRPYGSRDYLDAVTTAPMRGEIESGAVQLVALDPVGDDNGAHWMLARHKGYLVFDWLGLHNEHWARRHVRFLEHEGVQVEAVSEQIRTELEGRWVWPTVILCESVHLRIGDDEVAVENEGIAYEGVLYIPKGERSGEPVRQLSSFTDEHDQFLDADCDADCESLVDLIDRLRGVDPLQTLDSLLQGVKLGKYPILHGRTFRLTVGTGNAPGHSIALVDAAGKQAPRGPGGGRAGS